MKTYQLVAYILLGLLIWAVIGFGWGVAAFVMALFLHASIDNVGD